jgi:tetratricopeptide (TPR) repeat protein
MVDTLILLASVLTAAGELDDALLILEKAATLIQLRELFAASVFATTQRELAKVLAAKGDLTGAIERLQQVLATQRVVLERTDHQDHQDVAATLRELERLQALRRDIQRRG